MATGGRPVRHHSFLFACLGAMLVLIGGGPSALLAAWAASEPVTPPANLTSPHEGEFSTIEATVGENAHIIQGMPRHPRSSEVLHSIADLYTSEFQIDESAAYLRIAKDFPNSNLGLYALSSWLDGKHESGKTTTLLWNIIRDQPDTRLAKFALDRILRSAEDLVANCRRVSSEFGESAVGLYAREKMAQHFSDNGGYLEGLELYLDLYLDTIEHQPERLDVLQKNLASLFVQASLPYCAAATSAMRDLELKDQFLEALRLRQLVKRMSGREVGEGSSYGGDCYPALWNARADPDQLISITNQYPGSLAAARGQLLLAALKLQAGDIDTFASIMRGSLARWEQLDSGLTEKANLLLDACFYLSSKKEMSLSLNSDKRFRLCVSEVASALRHVFEHLKTSPASEADTVAMLLRLANAFHLELHTREELAVIQHLCNTFPGSVDSGALHLRAAKLYGERWQAYQDAAEECGKAKHLFERDPKAFEAAFLEAKNLYMAEDFKEAQNCLVELTQHDACDKLTQDALLLEAATEFRMGNMESSVQVLDRFAAVYQNSEYSDRVLFLKGYCYLAASRYAEALQTFQEFITVFPDSELGGKARRILQQLGRVREDLDAKSGQIHTSNKRPNVVLISLDTVRADHLSCYGYDRPTTPNIDRIAEEGIIFTSAMSTSSWTKPSHASLFTSLYPSVHGAIGSSYRMIPACKTMAQYFRELGYTTLGIISAPPLNSSFGFDRGFDVYDDYTFDLDRDFNLFLRDMSESHEQGLGSPTGFTGSLITDAAWALLRNLAAEERPFLLFVNYYDAHNDYLPPWPYSLKFDRNCQSVFPGKIDQWRNVEDLRNTVSTDDLARMTSLYDGEIAYVDEQVGNLVGRLKEQGEFSNTIFVIFGDHGEEFLEHGGVTHRKTLYNEVVHVPLIIAGSGVPKGVRCGHLVSLVDILPTLLPLVEGEVPEGLQGRDILLDIIEPRKANRALVFCELHWGVKDSVAIVRADSKLILNLWDDSVELFELELDRKEERNVAGKLPDLADSLMTQLAAFDSENQALRSKLEISGVDLARPSGEEMERVMSRMRSLGYVGE